MPDQEYRHEHKTLLKTDRLASRIFIALTILFILFIAMASCTSGYRPVFRENVLLRLKDLLFFQDTHIFHDARDITTNVLLYLPLGIFLSLAVSGARPRFLTPWLVLGFLISLFMETWQTFIGRYPDAIDLTTNTAGFLFGFWLVVVAIKFFGLRPSDLIGFSSREELDSKSKSIAALRFLYMTIYLLIALLPFDISVSFSHIYTKLLADGRGHLRIIFDPLYHFYFWPQHLGMLFLNLLGLIPVGFLTAFLDRLHRRFHVLSSIYACLILAMVSETAKIFILSATTDIIIFPLSILAGIIGWGIVKIWFKLQNAAESESLQPRTDHKKLLTTVLVFYALLICLISWAPYEFENDPRIIAKKIIQESNLIPFRAHFSLRGAPSALDLVSEAGLFIPLGVLLTFLRMQYWPTAPRWKMLLGAGVLCGVFALGVELSQAACLGRYVDVTDVILGMTGGMVGSVMLNLFSQNVIR